MKKSFKLLLLFIIALVAMFIGNDLVQADDLIPATFKATTYQMTTKPLGITERINIKKTTSGKYVYCLDVKKKLPTTNITYTRSNVMTDAGVDYIISSGYNDKNDNEFFATQAALWIYLMDTNQMTDNSYGYVKKIKEAVYSSKNTNDIIAKDIKTLVEGAKKATIQKYTFKIDTDNVEFTLRNGLYISNIIEIDTNIENSNYQVGFVGAPEGTTYAKVEGGFIVTIPVRNVDYGKTTIRIMAYDDVVDYSTYKYVSSDSDYQNMVVPFAFEEEFIDEIIASIELEEEEDEEPTRIIISKQDITNKGVELPGAVLAIRNSKGKIVAQMISLDEATVFDDLAVGKYTLEEITAPDGYKLSDEKISFEVKEDGKTKRIIMYNYPVDKTIVSISKQDITNKQELPGATLIIKNSKGEELYRWVSTEEPYIIKGLDEGKYTLEEITAPEGYRLSSEKITFEVEENGVVTEVVMFNTPESTVIVVPPTGLDASTIAYIFGGLIIIIGSVLIYKNVKKEQ